MSRSRKYLSAAPMAFIASLCCTTLANAQPTGTFQLDGADLGSNYNQRKHTAEVSAAASWNIVLGEPQLHFVAAWNDWRLSPYNFNLSAHLGVAVTADGFVTKTEYAGNPGPSNPTPYIKPTINVPSGLQSSKEFDPMTAVDPLTGDLYIGGVWKTDSNERGLFVARKPATQASVPHFLQAVSIVRNPANPTQDYLVAVADKPWMCAGRRPEPEHAQETRVYVAFYCDQAAGDPYLQRGLNLAVSDDHGATWAFPPTAIPTPTDISRISVTGPLPRVGADGKLYISMYDDELGRIVLQRSDDGGVSWLSAGPVVVASLMDYWRPSSLIGTSRLPGDPGRLGPWPCIAAHPTIASKLYCTFIDTTRVKWLGTLPPPSVGCTLYDLDVYFTKSTDFGVTWSVPVRLFTSNWADQFFPWIEVDTNGRLHISLYDTKTVDNEPPQNDCSLEGRYNNYYYCSDNDGLSWSETRLTSPSWILSCGTSPHGDAFNDYAGMALANLTAIPAFTTITRSPIPPPPPDPNDPYPCLWQNDGDIRVRVIP